MDFQNGILQISWSILLRRLIFFKNGGICVTRSIGIDIDMWAFELYPVDTDFSKDEFEEIQRGVGSGRRNQIVPVLIPKAIMQGDGINGKSDTRKSVSKSDTDIIDMDLPSV